MKACKHKYGSTHCNLKFFNGGWSWKIQTNVFVTWSWISSWWMNKSKHHKISISIKAETNVAHWNLNIHFPSLLETCVCCELLLISK